MAFAGLDADASLALAAAIGRGSSHPLDRALAAAAGDMALPPVTRREPHPGEGLEAVAGGRRTRLGRADFVAALHGLPPATAWPDTRDTVLWLGDETRWIGALRLADELRPGALELVASLQARGCEVHLVSGDEYHAVAAVARALGIEHVEARATPERKRAYVRALQLRGARVAMVGDGINDAPAIGEARVSIAMGGGADLAQVRADAVLLSDAPRDLAAALALARRTRTVIRQNLAWALAYNLAAIPLAFAGLVTPLGAGIGMAASSLLVVGNALRLRA
jgi:Cu2+-exporting ATPase